MTANPHHIPCLAALLILANLALVTPADAQPTAYPRVGLSGAPDHYQPAIDVHGRDPFDIYMIAVPPEGESAMLHDYRSFDWAVLEACCGGAATIVGEAFNPAYDHEGSVYGGVVTTVDECVTGEAVLLCTLTVQMDVDDEGIYWVIGGPLGLAYDCAGEGVLMTDMLINIHYTTDTSPTEATTWTTVRTLFN